MCFACFPEKNTYFKNIYVFVCVCVCVCVYIYIHTRFIEKVSGLTTVHAGFNPNFLQHSSLPQLHTSPNVSATVGNILRTSLSGCLIVSSSNFV